MTTPHNVMILSYEKMNIFSMYEMSKSIKGFEEKKENKFIIFPL